MNDKELWNAPGIRNTVHEGKKSNICPLALETRSEKAQRSEAKKKAMPSIPVNPRIPQLIPETMEMNT